jgi:hypothetical protein
MAVGLTGIPKTDEQSVHLPVIVDLVLFQRRWQDLPTWVLERHPE